MTVKQITSDTADEKIKQLYETAFPEDEQILIRLIEEMPLDFTAYYYGEDFIGFTIVYPRKQFNWFWYFAVCEEIRGKGYGQQILTQLIEKYKGKTCVLDMESPTQVCENIVQRVRSPCKIGMTSSTNCNSSGGLTTSMKNSVSPADAICLVESHSDYHLSTMRKARGR